MALSKRSSATRLPDSRPPESRRAESRRPRSRAWARWAALAVTPALLTFGAGGLEAGPAGAASVPSAPPSVTASPGNTVAIVRWTVPTSNGGSPITHYVVTPYYGTTPLPKKVVGTNTSTTIRGLTNKKTYTFRVSATNATGIGAPRSSAAIIVGAPAAPTGVTAKQSGGDVAGTVNAIVHWTPGLSNGSPITAYIVTTSANGIAKISHVYAAPATQATVGALSYGRTYTFRVAAANGRGPGPASSPSPSIVPACIGRALTNGQSDINAAAAGTTFCLKGTHNWSLTPKSGDKLIGPAVLDGGNITPVAINGNGTSNVVLAALEVRKYHMGDPNAAIAGHGTTGWMFRDLLVHDNGAGAAGGEGAQLGVSSRVVGGRYFNNRELGIGGGGGANGWVITGAEIDHNNFTNDTYTTRNINCGYQAGGVKWTADNAKIQNSKIHDNACKGLWVDVNADNTQILNNRVYRNWDEGIFIEISSGAKVTGNTVTYNGLHNFNGPGDGCPWLWGGGITLASSDHVTVANNTLLGNCNGITGTQQDRTDGNPGLLENESIRDNVIIGPGGKTGVVADNGADLATRGIVFSANTIEDHTFCAFNC
jgi:parallel beta-helix repeat protein